MWDTTLSARFIFTFRNKKEDSGAATDKSAL